MENSAVPIPLLSILFFSHEDKQTTERKIRPIRKELIMVFIILRFDTTKRYLNYNPDKDKNHAGKVALQWGNWLRAGSTELGANKFY